MSVELNSSENLSVSEGKICPLKTQSGFLEDIEIGGENWELRTENWEEKGTKVVSETKVWFIYFCRM